jgi:hypothetical protein
MPYQVRGAHEARFSTEAEARQHVNDTVGEDDEWAIQRFPDRVGAGVGVIVASGVGPTA